MSSERTMTLKEAEYDLMEWAESSEDGECHPASLGHWDLNAEQLEIIKEACEIPNAAASIANAMGGITDEEGLTSIANVLRTHR